MSNRKRPLSSIETEKSDEPPVKRQRVTNEIMDQLQHLLQNNKYNDIQFAVGTSDIQQIFNGNKLLFSAQSKVFEAMLFGPLSRSTTETIQIPDVNPLAFNYLHQLFCMKQPQLTFDIIVDVLYAAQKYLINIVIRQCKQKLYSINHLNDLYFILSSFEQYAPSVFDEIIADFLQNTKFIQQNFANVISDARFLTLQPFIVENIIKIDIFPTEVMKYELVKKYCISNTKSNNSWQALFKDKFLKYVRLKKLTIEYLLSVIKNDDIVSSDILLDIVNNKNNIGFKLYDVLLTNPQRKSLKVGDFIDVRDLNGIFWECCVSEKNNGIIRISFMGYDTLWTCVKSVSDWQYIARHKSVSRRKCVSRACLRDLKIGDLLYVNYAYHPAKGEMHENVWTKSKIVRKAASVKQELLQQILVKPVENCAVNATFADYYIHRDSQNECVCLDDKCEYCIRDL